MFSAKQVVLIDTNVVIEAHRKGCWMSLSQYFCFHTVEKVIEETQTGAANRSEAENIDVTALRQTFANIYNVSELERATFQATHNPVLDEGELDLMVYAGTLKVSEVWLLNSPDKAAVKHAFRRNWLDRTVSLEVMVRHLNISCLPLERNYTENWLSQLRTDLLLGNLR